MNDQSDITDNSFCPKSDCLTPGGAIKQIGNRTPSVNEASP